MTRMPVDIADMAQLIQSPSWLERHLAIDVSANLAQSTPAVQTASPPLTPADAVVIQHLVRRLLPMSATVTG